MIDATLASVTGLLAVVAGPEIPSFAFSVDPPRVFGALVFERRRVTIVLLHQSMIKSAINCNV